MDTLSKARQRLALSQGLAMGMQMSARPAIAGDKSRLEFAFRTAWRDWSESARFGTIKAGPAQDDVFLILGDEVRRGRRGIAWWASAWPFVPRCDGSDWDAMAEVIDDHVSAASWQALIDSWLPKGDL